MKTCISTAARTLVIAGAIWTSAIPLHATERRISGTIVKVDCGDGTNLVLKQKSGKKVEGVCYEKWCDSLCEENAVNARNRMAGRQIEASIRVVDTEEPGSGAISNEFFNILLQ